MKAASYYLMMMTLTMGAPLATGASCADEADPPANGADGALGLREGPLAACPGVGRYCAQELGAAGKTLYDCKASGAAPVALKTCAQYCAAASATKWSFCAKTAALPSQDLAIFAQGGYAGAQLLWSSGKNLVDSHKAAKACVGAPTQLCTDAGGQCASFMQWETGATATATWAPLEDNQLSIANAPDGTLVATFRNRNYAGLPHAMAKCGSLFCDANWATPGDDIVRRHAFTAAQLASYGFRVVAIPSAN